MPFGTYIGSSREWIKLLAFASYDKGSDNPSILQCDSWTNYDLPTLLFLYTAPYSNKSVHTLTKQKAHILFT